MRKLIAAGVCALGVLAFAGPAAAGLGVGVNDDAGKYADGAPQFWTTMKANGLKQNAVTVLWDETQPTTILDQSFIANALPAAQAAGVKVVFDVYPMHSRPFTENAAVNIPAFAAFLTKLAQTFPQVTEYVVMNECNQTRFINPQFTAAGQNQSAALCGQALAAGYDALKAVDPSIFVWGVGLSPRGNDNAQATSNASTSPVKFLAALGQWYRSSGRTKPLMDGFDFHPYPLPQSLPFAAGYADTDNASVSNLDRIYQAFYDGFKGTAQRTIGQQAGGGLPVSLNEVGIQVDATGRPGYTGTEVSASADGGVRGETATEAFQAGWYVQMLNLVACDPNVKVVNFFHLVDETDLAAWQSGLYYVGYTPKASAAAVQAWIAQTGGACAGSTRSWSPPGVPAATGGAVPGTADAQAKFQALLDAGVFDSVQGGFSGSLDGFLTRQGFAAVIAKLFGLDTPVFAGPSFGDIGENQWALAYVNAARALAQSSAQPNLTLTSQAFTDLLRNALGRFAVDTRLTVGLFPCSGICSPSALAGQALKQCPAFGLCDATRSTASAKAVRPVALGSTTVRAGASAKVKLKAVRGAKRSYGRYVLVLRLAAQRGSVKPAALAVRLDVTKARPATAKPTTATPTKAKPTKPVSPAKPAKPAKKK